MGLGREWWQAPRNTSLGVGRLDALPLGMSSLADGMTATLASLANWTGDKILYKGRSFDVITGPMVLVEGAETAGYSPAKVYQRAIQKKDFPTPPREGEAIKINGIEYTIRGDVQEEPLHYNITLVKQGA